MKLTMQMGVQYYRPPFPDSKYWNDDLSKIRDAGLGVVQLWACWGWIESNPGEFRFEDYDALIKKASERGLKVLISTVAEIQPFWMERIVPDAAMVDHMGNRVISSLRVECNVGLTPGGCTDNPKVREYMGRFFQQIAGRYGKMNEIIGWDCWNETRWNNQSDGYVCYCPATLNAFRDFLREKYSDLEGLNRAWRRRYADWEDVFPGKLPSRPYPDMLEFLRFLTWRANGIMQFRAGSLRAGGVEQIISAHCGVPAVLSTGGDGSSWDKYEQPLCRGNDWDFSSCLDGYGCSCFFSAQDSSDVNLGIRLEAIRSAIPDKVLWVSELQGGAARFGFQAQQPLPAELQQRWVWNGFSRGAKGLIFWCWRDEVFGCESGGFGLCGNDGLADERLIALSETAKVLHKHSDLLDNYQPDLGRIGILFEPSNYYLAWAQDGKAEKAVRSLTGYMRVLADLNVPYELVESSHVEILEKLNFLILPFPLVISDKLSERLVEFVNSGGVLLTEGELGAFDPLGFYRYPGTDRTLANRLGVPACKERQPINQEDFAVNLDGKIFPLKAGLWLTPLFLSKNAEVLASDKEGNVLAAANSVGKGKVYALGTFLGINYGADKEFDSNLANFIEHLLAAHDCRPELGVFFKDERKVASKLYWRSGKSGSERLLFVINPCDKKEVMCEAPDGFFKGDKIFDLRKDLQLSITDSPLKNYRKVLLEVKGWGLFRF